MGEPVLGPSGEGTVVLDIGADRGALIVWTPPSLDGTELDVRAAGSSWLGDHTAVRPRDLGTGRRFAAVFGSLAAGDYELRVRGGPPGTIVGADVVAGTVTEVTWPARDRAPAGRWSGGTWARPRP